MKAYHMIRYIKRLSIGGAMLVGIVLAIPAFSGTVSTQFDTSDGFITGDTNPITLNDGAFQVTFSGGQQQQMFDLDSYNVNPAGFLWINGNFNGVTGDGVSDDTGLIDFNFGVVEVSFFAANRGNGPGVTLNIFGVDDITPLGTLLVTQDSNQFVSGATITTLSSANFGGSLIGSIGIDLPGPAMNPPYVLALDTFRATMAVPAPATIWLFGGGMLGLIIFRRKIS